MGRRITEVHEHYSTRKKCVRSQSVVKISHRWVFPLCQGTNSQYNSDILRYTHMIA
jgi:hypothetical protein